MKVVCNNKKEKWCPYGTKNCECNMYNERDFVCGEDFNFSCTNINDDYKECHLMFIPENETELHIKKFFDMLELGMSVAESAKKVDFKNITMEYFLNVIAQNEFHCMRFQKHFVDKM